MKWKMTIIAAMLLFSLFAQAQQKLRVAVFTPLYLDSVYDAAGNFRFEKNNFPRYVLPGLEFYQGVQAAIDSLNKRGAPLEVFIQDSRGRVSISQQLNTPALRNLDLIIAQSNLAETKTIAEIAGQRKVPFISTTLPNDAGVTANPYFVVLNSTLQAHVESIYRFLQRFHSNDRIIVFRKPGSQEDQLKEYFTEMMTGSGPRLPIKFVDLPQAFSSQQVLAQLDSTKRNICIAGTLDESFGARLISEINSVNETYPARLIGMPTWERMNLGKNSVEILYTTPFYHNRSTPLEVRLSDAFNTEMSNRPSDVYFRGYESMLRFGLLLLDTKKELSSNLSRKGNTVFTQFDIQPVFKDKTAMTLDYFENKHLYFVKVFNGVKNIIN